MTTICFLSFFILFFVIVIDLESVLLRPVKLKVLAVLFLRCPVDREEFNEELDDEGEEVGEDSVEPDEVDIIRDDVDLRCLVGSIELAW
jgi:hypothetical protein